MNIVTVKSSYMNDCEDITSEQMHHHGRHAASQVANRVDEFRVSMLYLLFIWVQVRAYQRFDFFSRTPRHLIPRRAL